MSLSPSHSKTRTKPKALHNFHRKYCLQTENISIISLLPFTQIENNVKKSQTLSYKMATKGYSLCLALCLSVCLY